MSLRLAMQSPNMPSLDYTADASTSYTLGKLGVRNQSNAEIDEGTSTVITIECVINKTETSAATNPTIRAIPIVHGPQQLWIVDCNASTNVDQLNQTHNMTSSSVVNNTNTPNTSTAGVFVALKLVGASGDKKLLGYFIKLGQVTT